MTQGSYQQFCPVAMAAEIICTRWTTLVLRELICGSTRFNDLRRGLPRMSPALLSQRLKELEAAGVIAKESGGNEYKLTTSGRDLEPLIMALGQWGHRWIDQTVSLEKLDVSLLMWDMRRNLNPSPMPAKRSVIQFQYAELPATRRHWWLLVDPKSGVDLCSSDPGFDVDLYVSTDLHTMTAVWMGFETVRNAVRAQKMLLTGERSLASSMQTWLGLSVFAKERKLAS